MKNFSTAALFLTLVSAVLPATAFSQTPSNAVSGNARCAFLANAPDQHVVVRGDTLWGISGKFLERPWCWPQVWDMNREQIRNPHWIYPGQTVYFDRVAGRLRLGKEVGSDNSGVPTVRLSPQVRSTDAASDAISAVSFKSIEQFLTKPLIVEVDELKNTPRIVATQEGHVFLASGDKAYVRGDLQGRTSFQAFRPGKPLKDPVTKQIIGYEAMYLGTLKLQRLSKAENEPHTLTVVTAKEEMGVGDRLIPEEPTPFINYVPHAPEQPLEARIVSVYGGVSQAGQNQIVAINRGAKDGVDIGTVLELRRLGLMVPDRTTGNGRGLIKLPDEQYGELFVFRVFNNISYGLVMQVRDTVQVGDIAKSPE
ncbi:LysM peptidoglycan-binding domain-containing protein [Herminiimonas arsenitoxidans]|uniref:LysM peptidoglycan-binding domain-containing protein n=1 Tax=Herminiimonas arsenitoxidans TaxID=1809410 RepID=UPI00097108D8|nr:LysM peptidoglycan-binding domain-containing protein [Herminiimonas arsenitoxidans]